ncbi:S41 family peptidase [Parapedobacter sp. 10938]|uniref:S41 family peptidase n=1 Tax=Parapedobacter flavus TaxID=3110225 RepID=UPI002DBA39A6|nr:S41 family peptidase [Parapedobacter sp. 10938]MEC3881399.1 S41 family peptidase [Parapedobacter sp. 10938]
MRKATFLLTLLAASLWGACQSHHPNPVYNLDFETVSGGMPVGWSGNGNKNYRQSLDSVVTKSGNYAAVLEFTGDTPAFGTWTVILPENYPGKKITFSGYIKTEDVEGYAGLWMRIDPQIAFNNMQQEGISGTTDWKRYSFTLDMIPEKTDQIVLGALLAGTGKIWIDSLSVTIDGEDISRISPLKKAPAKQDTAFDKGSTINLPDLNATQTENLKTLGLVWGFIKYYHPKVASGEVNWDYELFRVLPHVLETRDVAERDKVLVEWIQKLGRLKEGNDMSAVTAKLQPDLDWITASGFSAELTELLTDIKQAKRTDTHYYIGMVPNVGNPEFKNEAAYAQMDPADDGFRLLALYRYWNMIQYFFPYKNLIEEDWKEVLGEFVTQFAAGDDTEGYVLALLELIGRVHDTHASLRGNPVLEKFFGERHAPVDVYFVEGQPVVTGYRHSQWGAATGLEVGDLITAVNGKAVADRASELQKYAPASNHARQLQDIGPMLVRSNDSTIRLDVLRDGQRLSKIVKTYTAGELTFNNPFYVEDKSFKIIGDDIAYINNGNFDAKDLPLYWDRMKDRKGLIIDVRNYPKHFPIHQLSAYLMPRPIPFVSYSRGSIQHPGLFVMSQPATVGVRNGKRYDGKVVVLVNEMSLSSAEYHAMAYRVHPNATVMGSATAGADGNVSPIMLPGGIRTVISGLGIYYPDGSETQRVGIVPDIEVKPTIKGMKEGRDEVLERAVRFINNP